MELESGFARGGCSGFERSDGSTTCVGVSEIDKEGRLVKLSRRLGTEVRGSMEFSEVGRLKCISALMVSSTCG
jgi:hypothetical protein